MNATFYIVELIKRERLVVEYFFDTFDVIAELYLTCKVQDNRDGKIKIYKKNVSGTGSMITNIACNVEMTLQMLPQFKDEDRKHG